MLRRSIWGSPLTIQSRSEFIIQLIADIFLEAELCLAAGEHARHGGYMPHEHRKPRKERKLHHQRIVHQQKRRNAHYRSSGHRANILSENFDYIGVGYTMVDGHPYWVQLFTGDFDL